MTTGTHNGDWQTKSPSKDRGYYRPVDTDRELVLRQSTGAGPDTIGLFPFTAFLHFDARSECHTDHTSLRVVLVTYGMLVLT